MGLDTATIDVHTHFVPSSTGRPHPDPRWPEIVVGHDGDHAAVMIAGSNYRTISRACWDPVRRTEDMDAEGVARQVVSPMPELLSPWLPAPVARDLCRTVNSELAGLVSAAPDRFVALGMVPVQDTDLALEELDHLCSLGLRGFELGSTIGASTAVDAVADALFAEAAARDLIVFVHAMRPDVQRLVGPAELENLLGFPTDIGLAAAAMITGGVLTRHPDLRVLVSHGGGTLPLLLARLQRGREVFGSVRALLPEPPEVLARRLWFDTLVYDQRPLQLLADTVGCDRLVTGSDYPFIVREAPPGAVLDGWAQPELAARIRHANACCLLGESA